MIMKKYIVLILVVGLMLKQVVELNNWFTFFTGVVIYTGIYVLLMYRFAMNDYEKDILRKPIYKILRKAVR